MKSTVIAGRNGERSARKGRFTGNSAQVEVSYKNIPTPFQGKGFHVGCKNLARKPMKPFGVSFGVAGRKCGASVESNGKCGETAESGIRTPINLSALRVAASDAVRQAECQGIGGAINWGDLDCVEASRVESDDGSVRYRVLIEEASPDAIKLQRYVAADLSEHGYPGVEVVTEW